MPGTTRLSRPSSSPLPSEADIAQEIARDVDPDAVQALEGLRQRIGERCARHLQDLRDSLSATTAPYSPDAASEPGEPLPTRPSISIAGADPALGERLAVDQIGDATNMTDRLLALGTLTLIRGAAREEALEQFGKTYADEPLALDKWFTLQAAIRKMERSAGCRYPCHPAFALSTQSGPRARGLLRHATRPSSTMRADRLRFLGEVVIGLDAIRSAARRAPGDVVRILADDGRAPPPESPNRLFAALPGRTVFPRDVGDIIQRSLAV